MSRIRLFLAAVCALLLFASQAPASSTNAPISLRIFQAEALLQPVAASEQHAILRSGPSATEHGVPHSADTPRLLTIPCAGHFLLATPDLADQVQARRPKLGFWACAPPDHRL